MTAKKVPAKRVKKISNGSKITIGGCEAPGLQGEKANFSIMEDNTQLPEPEMFESPESSTIMAATYTYTEPDMGWLTVLFKERNSSTGRLYQFTPKMSAAEWGAFKHASSKGEHFHQNIRSQYKGVKVG